MQNPSFRRIELLAAALALAVGIALAAVKFVAYGVTGSAAVFSDAVESLVNILTAGLALYAVRLAHRPPDEEHPYGHGKIEFISAGFEGGAIGLAGVFIALRTADQLGHLEVQRIDLGLMLVGLTILVNAGVGWMLIRLARRTGSAALEADGRHLISDSFTSLTAIAALAVVKYTGWVIVDPISAFAVAAVLGWMGWRVFRRAMGGLMDEQDSADHRRILAILDSHLAASGGRAPAICSYHKIRHRHAGRYHWVDMHLQFPAGTSVQEAHAAASAIEGEIEAGLGEGDATAHIEPCEDPACLRCAAPRPNASDHPE